VFQHAESELIATIENRISVLTNWAAEKSEGIKVLRYEAGEFFMPHIDCYRPGSPVYQKMIAQGGQRVATLILYLSDVEKGGCTFFPKQEMEIRPHRGMGIFFVNIEKDGQPDLLTYHSGEPVISGVKWIATKWLRAESFNPPLETQTE
jgi:prolyl 4-hydroxylase